MQPMRDPLPPHVPETLVREYPFIFGAVTDEHPFEQIVPRLHDYPEVFYAPHGGVGGGPVWIARRARDLRAIYFDTTHFSSKDFAQFAQMIGESWNEVPAEIDPPMHGIYRAFVNPLFAPKQMAKLEDRIRGYAMAYAETFRPRGECEIMQDFAFDFPIKVFLEMMGLPLELAPTFLAWEMDLLHTSDIGRISAAVRNVVGYLRGEIEDRRKTPGDDLISYGVKAKIEDRALTDDELVGFAFNLFIGGLDTVSTNMGWQFRHLAEHARDQATLRACPAMIPAAIDEFMRAYAAVTTFRTCVKQTEINGVTIMPGDKIAMATPLAGRDPQEYDRANEVILDRKAAHLSFGYGPHFCVGMQLAKREMRIALEAFLAVIPEFQVAPGARIAAHLGGIIQPVSVPIVWRK